MHTKANSLIFFYLYVGVTFASAAALLALSTFLPTNLVQAM